jgi:hypothetical protein
MSNNSVKGVFVIHFGFGFPNGNFGELFAAFTFSLLYVRI